MAIVVHQLNLDTVGGVEYLLKNFLEQRKDRRFLHQIFVGSRRIHPRFADTVRREAAGVHYLKYWRGLKVPRKPVVLRAHHGFGILRRLAPDAIVSWNRIHGEEWDRVKRHLHTRLVYYDQGAGWFCKRNASNREYLNAMDKIVACSRASRRTMELRLGIQKDIQVIPNAVRPDLVTKPVNAKVLPEDRPLHLGVAGRLMPAKGICLAIHAARVLLKRGIDVRLAVAGTGRLERQHKSLAAQLGIGSRVDFLGSVRDMAEFYANVDLALCPSLHDPMPLVTLEAMACACPVIATGVDGFPEMVREGITGRCLAPTRPLRDYPALGGSLDVLPPHVYDPQSDDLREPGLVDPEALAQAVGQMVEDPERYRQMSAAALASVCEHWRFEDFMQALEDAFLEGLGEAA
jgi:glycosyltransferase involved in cell wall biosynthesis